MTEFYFNFETLGLDPSKDKIITIQYQKIDTTTGKKTGPLIILKEWESSEREVFREFLEVLNPDDVWDFIPIGYNLKFDLFFLQQRFEKVLKLGISDKWLNIDMPRVDIKDIIVIMNNGRFKGATLDWFTRKEMDNSMIPKWYHGKEYSKIEDYITEETQRFLHAYQYLKQRLPGLYKEYSSLE